MLVKALTHQADGWPSANVGPSVDVHLAFVVCPTPLALVGFVTGQIEHVESSVVSERNHFN